MNAGEAKKRAAKKYIELWGEDWVRENAGHIGDSCGYLADDKYKITIDEWTPRPLDYYPDGTPKIWMGGDFRSKPNHRTVFLFDLKAGTMEIIEHY